MISAVDTSVILDVLVGRPTEAEASLATIRTASLQGQLILCECVVAEIRPAFAEQQDLEAFLNDWGLLFVPSTLDSALLAGRMLARQLQRKGEKQGRIRADFLIGAHAQLQADRLVARDRGYLRDYFAELTILAPAV